MVAAIFDFDRYFFPFPTSLAEGPRSEGEGEGVLPGLGLGEGGGLSGLGTAVKAPTRALGPSLMDRKPLGRGVCHVPGALEVGSLPEMSMGVLGSGAEVPRGASGNLGVEKSPSRDG